MEADKILQWLSQPECDLFIKCLSDEVSALQCEFAHTVAKQDQEALLKYDHIPDKNRVLSMSEKQSFVKFMREAISGRYKFEKIESLTSQ